MMSIMWVGEGRLANPERFEKGKKVDEKVI